MANVQLWRIWQSTRLVHGVYVRGNCVRRLKRELFSLCIRRSLLLARYACPPPGVARLRARLCRGSTWLDHNRRIRSESSKAAGLCDIAANSYVEVQLNGWTVVLLVGNPFRARSSGGGGGALARMSRCSRTAARRGKFFYLLGPS